MSLKKDSKKSKAILQGIDIFLGVLALMVLGYCGYLLYSLNAMPQAEAMDAEILAAQRQVALMEARVEEQTRFVTDAETAARIAMETAQEELALVQAEMDAVTAEHADLTAQAQEMEAKLVGSEQLRQDIARIRTEYGQAVRTLEDMILAGESDYRICYLTFDDGPSYMTPDFLDKLDKLDVYVTFFTIGVQMGENGKELRNQLLRREALAGHAIANHTYTHGIYTDLYDSLDIFMKAVQDQDDLVYQITGIKPDVFRFPAGSYYCPFRTAAIEELEKLGYGWIDWIGNAYDSGHDPWPSQRVANTVIWQVSQDKVTVVLMHDWRSDTLGALERIVTTLKQQNYLFLPLFKESSTVGTASPKWDN